MKILILYKCCLVKMKVGLIRHSILDKINRKHISQVLYQNYNQDIYIANQLFKYLPFPKYKILKIVQHLLIEKEA